MKLKAKLVPYSSTVGGGLSLIDESGRVRFMVAIFGASHGITKEETTIISKALIAGLPPEGIEVPER
jgi:hypothetical protein